MAVPIACPCKGLSAELAQLVLDSEVRANVIFHVAQRVALLATRHATDQSSAPPPHCPVMIYLGHDLDVHHDLFPELLFRHIYLASII